MDHNVRRSLGQESESLVEEALEELRRKQEHDLEHKGEKISSEPIIERVVHAPPNSNMDRQGKDFEIHFSNGQKVPLQVKSSERKRKHFEKCCRKRHIFIPVVVVHVGESVYRIIHRIKECIKLFLSRMQRQMNERIHALHVKQSRKKPWCNRHFAPSMCH